MENLVILDIGSNSVRMAINQIQDNGSYREIKRVKSDSRLSEGMGRERILQPGSMKRTIAALLDFQKIYQAYEFINVIGIATAAVRQAANQNDFLIAVKENLGIEVKVLSGSQEAYYDYLGVVTRLGYKDCVILDVGGASCELIRVTNKKDANLTSLPIGAVNLTERYHLNDLVLGANLFSAQLNVRKLYAKVKWLDHAKRLPLVLLGGANRTLARINRKRQHMARIDAIHGYHLSAEQVNRTYLSLLRKTMRQRQQISGLERDRADIIIGGLLPLAVLMETIETKRVWFLKAVSARELSWEYIEQSQSNAKKYKFIIMNGDFMAFYQEDYPTRLKIIKRRTGLSDSQAAYLLTHHDNISDELIENYVTDYSLPMGVVPDIIINQKTYIVPLVTEEPSVIAAASNGAKMLGNSLQAEVSKHSLDGQIVLKTPEFEKVVTFVAYNKDALIKIGISAHPTIVNYGDGVRSIAVRKLAEQFVSIDVVLDPGEAFGANGMNVILEAMASYCSDQLHMEVTMAVLSNYQSEGNVTVSGKIPVERLTTKKMSGITIAHKIVDASYVAQIDPRRAVTHNKGIMNGVTGVAVALGNDSRALESAVHSFAARNGQYQGLSEWRLNGTDLVGSMKLPVPIGFIGGATSVLPLVKITKQIINVNDVKEEMQVIAGIGLAQNLAALRALVSEGISRGHMNLQYKSLALANGARNSELAEVVDYLRQLDNPSANDVSDFLIKLRK